MVVVVTTDTGSWKPEHKSNPHQLCRGDDTRGFRREGFALLLSEGREARVMVLRVTVLARPGHVHVMRPLRATRAGWERLKTSFFLIFSDSRTAWEKHLRQARARTYLCVSDHVNDPHVASRGDELVSPRRTVDGEGAATPRSGRGGGAGTGSLLSRRWGHRHLLRLI